MKFNCTLAICLISLFSFFTRQVKAQICDSTANIVLFSNYDGGILNINVDVNIPNLKIGITTYEAVEVNIAGPYAGNVTQVVYAGYNSNNNHCTTVIPTTTINGVPSNLVTIIFAPPATLSDPNGNSSIICAYSCGPGTQGGCNTSLQVMHYFTTTMGGSIFSYFTQYGCWSNAGYSISAGGNCCPPQPVNAYFTPSASVICAGDCITFSNQTTGVATAWNWTFPGASVPASTQQQPGTICYNTPGVYPVTLTASNATLSDVHTDTIYVGQAYADSVNATICLGDVYTFPDGTTSQANTTHVSYLTGAYGCDSIITTQLSVVSIDTSITNLGVLTVNVQIPAVQWVNCNGYVPIPGQTGYSFYPLSTGYYAAILTIGGCTDTSGCHYVQTLGLNDPNEAAFVLSPNPVTDLLSVKCLNGQCGENVRVYDLSGREMKLMIRTTDDGYLIDCSPISPGMYLLESDGFRSAFIRH